MFFVLGMGLCAQSQTVTLTDNGFKKCINDSFPAALDSRHNLILAQVGIVTALHCPNYNMANVTGLGSLTALKELDLSNNPILTLPDMSNLGALVDLNIGQTSITTLPDFTKLTNLQSLSIHRLSLTKFPDVSKNINLVKLIAHSNNFDSVPILTLPKLEYLDVSFAGLKKLSNLSGLPKLKQLDCFRNLLTDFPDFSGLDSLKILDASSNLIDSLHKMPQNMETLYVDNNNILKISDLSSNKKLKKVRLYNNSLSFEDLVPIASISGYDAIFEVSPQKEFFVSQNQILNEFDSLSLDSKLDSNVLGITRTWVFNNVPTSQSNRVFKNKQVDVSNEGYYYCMLTHPSFTLLNIKTNNIYVDVLPCVAVNEVFTQVTEGTCLKQGAIKVTLKSQPRTSYGFQLESNQSKIIYDSQTGIFEGLSDTSYKLTVIADNGCKHTISTSVVVPKESCKQLVVTPNNDGIDDEYYFTQSGNAKIVDKWGNSIHQLSLPVIWDAHINGKKIPVGYYIININDGKEILKMSIIY